MDNPRLNAYNSDGNAVELSTPWSPPSDSQIGVDELDELSDSEPELPLLRLHEWDNEHHYDRTNPECIHYDLRWKISQRERIRARQVSQGSKLDVVLAPSDYWRVTLQSVVDAILSDQEKFPGDNYVHETTSIGISIERTRSRGFSECFENTTVDWDMVDDHLEGLGDLVRLGKKITVHIELVYKEESQLSAGSKRKGKKQSATEAQKAQRAAEAGLWTRVYKHRRCRAKHCKNGPHCWPDEQGIHHKLEARHLEDILNDLKDNMKEGETEADIDVAVGIPPRILQDVLNESRKRKATAPESCRPCKIHISSHPGYGFVTGAATEEQFMSISGDRARRLEEYCCWGLAQTEDEAWKTGLRACNDCAMDNLLDVNAVLQYPLTVVDLLTDGGVKRGIALQFVSKINIERWWKESQGSRA